MDKMGEMKAKVFPDQDPDAWTEAVIVAETAIGAQERYLRDLASGSCPEARAIETVEL